MATDSGANRFCRATLPSPSSPSTASSPHTPSPSGPPSTRARPTQNPCTKRRADSESLHKKANTPAERPGRTHRQNAPAERLGRTHRQNAPTGAPTERTGRTHRRANSESLHKKAGRLRIPAQKGQHTGRTPRQNAPAERTGRTPRQNAPAERTDRRTDRTHRQNAPAGQLRIPAQKGGPTQNPCTKRPTHRSAHLAGAGSQDISWRGAPTRAWLRGNALARGQVG